MILPVGNELQQRSIITLTTDFGLSDHYVGTMKGVLLARSPHSALVDITHQVRPFSLFDGAYAIAQSAPYFPAGTVHLVVVDPGVGTERRPIAVRADEQIFVAPDNGVLSLVLEGKPHSAFTIEDRTLMRPCISSTFHGRDIFAPIAAGLASGSVELACVGTPLDQLVQLPDLQEREIKPGVFLGRILSIDHFGNVITNFRAAHHSSVATQTFRLQMEGGDVTTFSRTFAPAPANVCFAYFGSSGFLEIGMNRASAAAQLGAEPGATVGLTYVPSDT